MNLDITKGKTINRVLVTGGAGFIGSHTVDLLLKEGKEVVVLDNLSSGKLTNLNMQHPDLEFIEGDVLEYPLLEELVVSCDAVLHLAALVSVPASFENPIFFVSGKYARQFTCIASGEKATHPVRIVYASSAAVYGDAAELPCRDDAPLLSPPLSPYALQKIHAENYANLYERLHGVKSLGMRYFNVYGSRQDPSSPYSGVISRFQEAYQNDETLTVFGDGEQSRDFIHVSDIAKANLLALESTHTGVFNIATGKACTLLQLIKHMEAAGGHPAKIVHQAARPGDIKASYASVQQAKAQLGFQSSLSLAEGIGFLMKERV